MEGAWPAELADLVKIPSFAACLEELEVASLSDFGDCIDEDEGHYTRLREVIQALPTKPRRNMLLRNRSLQTLNDLLQRLTLFVEFDEDQDGYLSRVECMRIPAGKMQARVGGTIGDHFDAMDSDGDGRISFTELFLAAEVVADADEAVPPDTAAATVEPEPEPNTQPAPTPASPPQAAGIELWVKTPDGATLRVAADSGVSTTVAQLRSQIAASAGLDVSSCRLIFAGRELEDQMSLRDYNCQNASELHLILRVEEADTSLDREAEEETASMRAQLAGKKLVDFRVIKKVGGKDLMAGGGRSASISQSGVCSYVYQAQLCSGPRVQFAIKVMLNMADTANSVAISQEFDAETALLSDPHRLPAHRHVMVVLHSFMDDAAGLPSWDFEADIVNPRTLFVVMPYFQDDLKRVFKRTRQQGRQFGELRAVKIIHDLLRAVRHLKQHGIVHRDVKLDNVLIANPGVDSEAAVLTDFGMCLDLTKNRIDSGRVPLPYDGIRRGGAPIALPPEVVLPKPGPDVYLDYSKTDEWGVGMIAHELLSKEDQDPFGDFEHPATYTDVGYRDEKIPTLSRPLVSALLRVAISDRLAASDACRRAARLERDLREAAEQQPTQPSEPAAREDDGGGNPTFCTTTGRHCSLSDGSDGSNTVARRTDSFYVAVALLEPQLSARADGSWRFEIEVLDNSSSYSGAVELGFTTRSPSTLASVIPDAENICDIGTEGDNLWSLSNSGSSVFNNEGLQNHSHVQVAFFRDASFQVWVDGHSECGRKKLRSNEGRRPPPADAVIYGVCNLYGKTEAVRACKLSSLYPADSDLYWCKKDAAAKHNGKVGMLLMEPDSDTEVKVKWTDGKTSSYIKAAELTEASVAEQIEAVSSWCKVGVIAKHDDRVGRITKAPDSDAEIKMRYETGEESEYLKAISVHPASSEEVASFGGGGSPLTEGAQVKLLADVATVRSLAEGHGGWNDRMASYCGQTGIARHIDGDGDTMVQFVDGEMFMFNRQALVLDSGARGLTIDIPGAVSLIKSTLGDVCHTWTNAGWDDEDEYNTSVRNGLQHGPTETNPCVVAKGLSDSRADELLTAFAGTPLASRHRLQAKRVGGDRVALFLGAGGPSMPGGRLVVGDKVKLAAGFRGVDDAAQGPLELGDIGTVVEDDGSSKPFRVQAPDGKCWWYKPAAIVAVDGGDTGGVQGTNDEGAAVALGGDAGYSHLYYCGRHLGVQAIPGSDGMCGPNNGPQCQSCKRYQESLTAETVVIVSGAGITCCNGTYKLQDDAGAERAWVKEGSGEYLKPVYDSDWGWVMSDSGSTYQYFSDPAGRVDRTTPPSSAEVSWRGWTSVAKNSPMPTVTVVRGGSSAGSGSHPGEWRGADKNQWCSKPDAREGMVCTHAGGVLQREHWSCCGGTSRSAACTAAGGGSGVDTSNPRSWCKRGAWASLDGRIGKLTMDPDSDSEVKLKWSDGDTSSFVKIDRLLHVGQGKHPSHRHALAPIERSGWHCDVCRVSNPGGARFRCTEGCDYDVCVSCWSGASSSGRFQVGARVRVRAGITPQYGWGSAKGAIGVVKRLDSDGDVVINFPEQSNWTGKQSEIEVVSGVPSTKTFFTEVNMSCIQDTSICGAGGCGADCTQTHGMDEICLVCGNRYGQHNDHTCPTGDGQRGSFSGERRSGSTSEDDDEPMLSFLRMLMDDSDD